MKMIGHDTEAYNLDSEDRRERFEAIASPGLAMVEVLPAVRVFADFLGFLIQTFFI
jgi:hypothetical protein